MAVENVRLFPATEAEAIAMLWVQQQELTDKTPEEIYDMYKDAYDKVVKHHKMRRANGLS